MKHLYTRAQIKTYICIIHVNENLSSLKSWAPSPRQGDSHEGEKMGSNNQLKVKFVFFLNIEKEYAKS